MKISDKRYNAHPHQITSHLSPKLQKFNTSRNSKQNTKINVSHSKHSSKSSPQQRIIQQKYYRMPKTPTLAPN